MENIYNTPAIEAGLAFLKEIGHEEKSEFLTHAIIAANPSNAGGDDGWWFTMQTYYYESLLPHKVEVFKAGMKLWYAGCVNSYRSSENFAKEIWINRLIVHDVSKYSWREEGYAEQTSNDISNACFGYSMKTAWGFHQGANFHHPESAYRLDRSGKVVEVMPMMEHDIIEMVADWIGASWSIGPKDGDYIGYLTKNLHQWRWHSSTLKILVKTLNKISIHLTFNWVGPNEIGNVSIGTIHRCPS